MLAALASLVLAVSPALPAKDGLVHVRVHNLRAPSAQIRIEGGLASGGRWFGWVELLPAGPASWRTVLRAPGYLGVYPVQVRVGHTVTEPGIMLKVLPRNFDRQPGFFTPAEVAEWWATRLPPGSHVVSVTTWHHGFFTHRDPRLNLLLRVRVAYGADGDVDTRYLSIARLRTTGPWRLLEVPRAP